MVLVGGVHLSFYHQEDVVEEQPEDIIWTEKRLLTTSPGGDVLIQETDDSQESSGVTRSIFLNVTASAAAPAADCADIMSKSAANWQQLASTLLLQLFTCFAVVKHLLNNKDYYKKHSV